jgi:SAM-dependent methyltransferase
MSTAESVYSHRFSDEDAAEKHALWEVIGRYLQRFLPDDAVVLDLACDRGYFIEHVEAHEKWASDIRDMSGHLSRGVTFVQSDGLTLDRVVPTGAFDVVFTSNYLEHLASGDEVIAQLEVVARVARLLKPGGQAIVLQPNIRLLGGSYWDFIDHKVALTDASLTEAAELAGLETVRVVKRFLPYTTRGWLPMSPFLVRSYLAFRPAWLVLGKQTLFIAQRPA